MNLKIHGNFFLICGASSGFGKAIATALMNEGANVLAIARNEERLNALESSFPDQCETLAGDLTQQATIEKISDKVAGRTPAGIVLNSGGPPTGDAQDTTGEDWDSAYKSVFRWKAEIIRHLLPALKSAEYGRILFIESQSIKQPIPKLAQSNALRAAVAGYAKTLSQEVASIGITVNILAPGSHNTPAIERVIASRQEEWELSYEDARLAMENQVPVKRFGDADEMASLAAWLLSPLSGYVTGQVISHDGGKITGLFG